LVTRNHSTTCPLESVNEPTLRKRRCEFAALVLAAAGCGSWQTRRYDVQLPLLSQVV
jgi:hypothetical protein